MVNGKTGGKELLEVVVLDGELLDGVFQLLLGDLGGEEEMVFVFGDSRVQQELGGLEIRWRV